MGQGTEIFQSVNKHPNYCHIYSKPWRDRPVVYAVERDTKMWQYFFSQNFKSDQREISTKKIKFS